MTQFKEKLDSIVGKPFFYRNESVVVTKYKDVNSSNVVVFLNDRPRNFLYSDLELFFQELLEPGINNKPFVPKIDISTENIISFQPTKENEEMKLTLMETLRKVKEDAKYIAQANAICSVVYQVVNIQKEEIKMIQMLRK